MMEGESTPRIIIIEAENFDKKSLQTTFNHSEILNNKALVDFQFIRVTPERKRIKRQNSGASASVPVNNTEKMVIFSENFKECPNVRRDKFNIIIKKGGKEHKISFKDDFVEKVFIDSFKDLNKSSEIKISARCSNCACKII